MDVIVNNITIRHFVDPRGAIAQTYEALKPNGILAIDIFHLRGLEESFPSIITLLQNQGYKIVAGDSLDMKLQLQPGTYGRVPNNGTIKDSVNPLMTTLQTFYKQ